jgi:hypothetical protein
MPRNCFVLCVSGLEFIDFLNYFSSHSSSHPRLIQLGDSLPPCSTLPALPPKKIFGNMEPEFIEARRIALEAYVQSVMRQPALARLPLVREFMPALLTRYAALAPCGSASGSGSGSGSATSAGAPASQLFSFSSAGNSSSHDNSSSSSSSSSWPRSAAAPHKSSAAIPYADSSALSPLPPHAPLSSAPSERVVTEFACHRVFMFSKNQSLNALIHISDAKIEFQVRTWPSMSIFCC